MTDNNVRDDLNNQNPIQQNDIGDDSDGKIDFLVPEDAKKFLGAILDESGLVLNEEVREEMIKELFVKLDAMIMGRVMDALPDNKVDAFMDLQEKNSSPEEIQKFIDENLPNADDLFAATFAEFRNVYLTNVDIFQAKKDVKDESLPSQQPDPLEAIAAGKHDSMQ